MNRTLGTKRLWNGLFLVAFLLPQIMQAQQVNLSNINSCVAPDPIYILKKIAATKPNILAAGGTSGLTLITTRAVFAVKTLAVQKKLAGNRQLASAAVKQILLSSIQHTINIIKKRLMEIIAASKVA